MVVHKKDCCDGLSLLRLNDVRTAIMFLDAQGSDAWLQAREQCHATASEFSSVCSRNWFTSREILLQRKLKILDSFCGNSATRYGQYCEDIAVKEYESRKGVSVQRAGLVVHPVYRNFGGSPDGFVDDGTGDGMIEVKCPFKYRHNLVLPRHRVCPRHYRDQIQGLLEITGRAWCDLVVWCPRDMVTVRIERDRVYWDKEIFPHLMSFSAELRKRRKVATPLMQASPPRHVDVFASEFSTVCRRNVFMTRTKMYRKKMAQWRRNAKKGGERKRRKLASSVTSLMRAAKLKLPQDVQSTIARMALDLCYRSQWAKVMSHVRTVVPLTRGSECRPHNFRFGLMGWVNLVQGKEVVVRF
jgi:putative phage-type endonuclease